MPMPTLDEKLAVLGPYVKREPPTRLPPDISPKRMAEVLATRPQVRLRGGAWPDFEPWLSAHAPDPAQWEIRPGLARPTKPAAKARTHAVAVPVPETRLDGVLVDGEVWDEAHVRTVLAQLHAAQRTAQENMRAAGRLTTQLAEVTRERDAARAYARGLAAKLPTEQLVQELRETREPVTPATPKPAGFSIFKSNPRAA